MIFMGGVHSTNLKKMGNIIKIYVFLMFFSDFAVLGGLVGLQPEFFFQVTLRYIQK